MRLSTKPVPNEKNNDLQNTEYKETDYPNLDL